MNKSKSLKIGVSIVTVCVLIISAIIGVVVALENKKADIIGGGVGSGSDKDFVASDDNGNKFENGEVYDMPGNLVFTADVQATSAVNVNLVATITPDTAATRELDWATEWVNPNSTFANGKAVTDFVSVAPTADGAKTATVTCSNPFGEQVKIVVKSRMNANVKAECVVDYQAKLASVGVTVDCVNGMSPSRYTFNSPNVDMVLNRHYSQAELRSLNNSNMPLTYIYNYKSVYTKPCVVNSNTMRFKRSQALCDIQNAPGHGIITLYNTNWHDTILNYAQVSDILMHSSQWITDTTTVENGGVDTNSYDGFLRYCVTNKAHDFELEITTTTASETFKTTMLVTISDNTPGMKIEGITVNSPSLVF